MQNYDVHAKQHFLMPNQVKRPNFWNLALKMPTWQPCQAWFDYWLSFAKLIFRFISTCAVWRGKEKCQRHTSGDIYDWLKRREF